MKAFLMYRDRDLDVEQETPTNSADLVNDLGLSTILEAMARRDPFVLQVATGALLGSLQDIDAIRYRQDVLVDSIDHAAVVRELYAIATEGAKADKQVFSGLMNSPDSILSWSAQMLEILLVILRRLRGLADAHAADFDAEGFRQLFATLAEELDDDWFTTADKHLTTLQFPRGALLSAELGSGLKGARYVLRRPHVYGLVDRISGRNRTGLSFQLAERDENGFRTLTELRGRGINLVANALAQATDSILGFFGMLQAELAFYIGCINLHETLASKRQSLCIPEPLAPDLVALSTRGLYDASLALRSDDDVVGNSVDADGRSLIIVTGANQGGKSTFLRSIGAAQLMLQAGMFVPAVAHRASLAHGVFTHYKREEDPEMRHGKLDEELARMSAIADHIDASALLLCNESFASTNEREGSEIAREILRALTEAGIRVVFVTHMFELANRLHRTAGDEALFLRAERRSDGERTFRIVEGEPLPTSYGADLYARIFGTAPDPLSGATQRRG